MKPPVNFSSFLGNARIVDILGRAIRQGRLPHAMIFAGPSGVGKRTLALLLAQFLNCLSPQDDEPCSNCASCRKIVSGSHPDVRVIQPDGAYIKVDQVREMIGEIAYQPFEGRYRMVILDGAEQMKQEAANSLLKTLEEPPSPTIIILVTTNPYLLLGTIRSRSRMLQFGGIPQDRIESHLMSIEGRKAEEARMAAVFSNGSLGIALSLDPDRYRELRTQALSFVSLLIKRGRFAEVSRLAAAVSKEKELFPAWVEAVTTLLQEVYFAIVAPQRLARSDVAGEIDALARIASRSFIVSAIESLKQLRFAVQLNANRPLALEALFLESLQANERN